jgi:hypothetical protein
LAGAARSFASADNRRKYTIVLAAYLDASDPEPGVPVAVVAGFLASTEEWARFESLWKPFLKEFGIARFHATKYFARREQFQNWGDAKHLAAQGEVCRILNEIRPIGVGTALDTRAFDEWRARSDTFFPPDDEPAHHPNRTRARLFGNRPAGDIGFGAAGIAARVNASTFTRPRA